MNENLEKGSLVNDSCLNAALEKVRADGFSISERDAKPVVKNLIERNKVSRRNGEENYFSTNLNATMREYNLTGEASTPLRKAAGYYFSMLEKFEEEQADSAYMQEQEILRDMAATKWQRGGDPED